MSDFICANLYLLVGIAVACFYVFLGLLSPLSETWIWTEEHKLYTQRQKYLRAKEHEARMKWLREENARLSR